MTSKRSMTRRVMSLPQSEHHEQPEQDARLVLKDDPCRGIMSARSAE